MKGDDSAFRPYMQLSFIIPRGGHGMIGEVSFIIQRGGLGMIGEGASETDAPEETKEGLGGNG